MIEKPSPGYSTTPWIGESEKPGTKAATLLPMAWVNFWVSQVPSTIMAAFPEVNCSMLSVVVRTLLLVQPCFSRLAHLVNCDSTWGEFQGIEPSYRPFHCGTLNWPIIR